jgi:hypothetical protein
LGTKCEPERVRLTTRMWHHTLKKMGPDGRIFLLTRNLVGLDPDLTGTTQGWTQVARFRVWGCRKLELSPYSLCISRSALVTIGHTNTLPWEARRSHASSP